MVDADFAYYYPEPYWSAYDQGAVKGMLLLFDGLSLLVPEYIDLTQRMSPELHEPLQDVGKLEIIRPETAITPEIANRVSEAIVSLLESGAFEGTSGEFEALSMSRAGFGILDGVPDATNELLEEAGLAKTTEDGVSIPMDRRVRFAYLFLLGQMSGGFNRVGGRLHPALDTRLPHLAQGFVDFLGLPGMPSASRSVVLAHDMQVLNVDVSDVPLDELLSFRSDNRHAFVQYSANLRDFAIKLSMIEEEGDREQAIEARELELLAASQDLRRRLRTAWRQPKAIAGFSLGVVGAGFSLASGNIVGGVLGASAAATRLLPDGVDAGVYSYLVKAGRNHW